MARHSNVSDVRAWMAVVAELALVSARLMSTWLVLILISLIPGAIVAGIAYLLLNDLTADPWLSAIAASVAGVVTSGTMVFSIGRSETR